MNKPMLSPHFSEAEATKSQTAMRRGIDNSFTTPDHRTNAIMVADKILEPVRKEFKRGFAPSSWYRSRSLNTAIGGATSSQHCKGEAVDFEIPGIANILVAEFIRDQLEYDQLILEFYDAAVMNSGWIHCSFVVSRDCRKQALRTADGKTYLEGLS